MKVRFELLDLDAPVAKVGEFERALMCYVRSTAASERTDTREIAHWRDVIVTERGGIRFYALKINGEIAGYAQYRYVSKSQVAIIDYLCIEPQRESNASYFTFIELICSLIEKSYEVLYIISEINFNLDNQSKDEANRYWLRVLELAGFKVAQTQYLLPSLIIDIPSDNRTGVLLIRSNDKSSQMSNKTYLSILGCIYFDHYIAWYKPFRKDISQYYSVLKKEIERASSKLKKDNYVKLNGSLKHSGLVSPQQIEPSFSGKAIYVLITFGLLFIVASSAGISILSVYVGLGPSTAILIFLISMFIFAGLIAIFMPSRLEALKLLIKPVLKLFSGL